VKFVELYAESLCEEIVKRVELYVCKCLQRTCAGNVNFCWRRGGGDVEL